MIQLVFLSMLLPLFVFGSEKATLFSPSLILGGFVLVILLFFWGIYKAVKTQNKYYALALLPFIIVLFILFFI